MKVYTLTRYAAVVAAAAAYVQAAVVRTSDTDDCGCNGCEAADNTVHVIFKGANSQYDMYVPPINGSLWSDTWRILEPSANISCIHTSASGTPCGSCEAYTDTIETPENTFCTIDMSNANGDVTANYDIYGGEFKIPKPGLVKDIACAKNSEVAEHPGPEPRSMSTSDDCGCEGGDKNQHLAFNGGDSLYDMFIPMDGETYQVRGKSANIQCVNTSAPDGPCVSCDTHMDYVQLTSDGNCEITMVNDAGNKTEHYSLTGTTRLGFGLPGHPKDIKCFPSQAVARDTQATDLTCQRDSKSVIAFLANREESNPDYYYLDIPNNKTVYNFVRGDDKLNCAGPGKIGNLKNAPCTTCDFTFDQLEVSEDAGICAFAFTNYDHTVYLNYDMGNFNLTGPTKMLSVECGLTPADIVPPEQSALSTTSQLEARGWSAWCNDPKQTGGIAFGDETHGLYETIYIYPDQQKNIVSGTGQDVGEATKSLGCVDGDKTGCQLCTQGWNQFVQSGGSVVLNYCRLGSATGLQLLGPGITLVGDTTTILWISCGFTFSDLDMNERRALHASIPAHQMTDGQNLAITTVDGDIYFATLSIDGQTHAFSDLHCIRVTDAASIPCNTIGAAISVATKIETGPCTFVTEDGSEVIAPYVESSREPYSLMSPLVGIPSVSPLTTFKCGNPQAKRELSVPTPYSPDPNCPASNWWSVLFYATDGHTYWASVNPDKQWHPMTNMACIRTVDGACLSRNTMGLINNVQVANGALPCSIWAYDTKSYRVEWSDIQDSSGMTRLVPLFTTASVSGIACGV